MGISSFLSKPIHVLHDAMDEVQEGNLDTHVDMERQDEFGELAENFNIMTKSKTILARHNHITHHDIRMDFLNLLKSRIC